MIRSALHAVAIALVAALAVVVTGDAAAHPGHGTPHLLHEADAIASWWVVGAACAVAAGVLFLRKDRS
jgi:hypothetical protein